MPQRSRLLTLCLRNRTRQGHSQRLHRQKRSHDRRKGARGPRHGSRRARPFWGARLTDPKTRGGRRPATASGTRRYGYSANGQLVDDGAGHGRKYRRGSQTAARARREMAIRADARASPRSARRVDRAEDAFPACALLAAAHTGGSALANDRRTDAPLRSGMTRSGRMSLAVRPVFPQGSSLTSSSNGYRSRRKGSLCRLLLRACSGTDVAASPSTWALRTRSSS